MKQPPVILLFLLLILTFSGCTKKEPVKKQKADIPAEYYEKGRKEQQPCAMLRDFDEGLQHLQDRRDSILLDLLEGKVYAYTLKGDYNSAFPVADSLIHAAQFQQDTLMLANGLYRKSRLQRFQHNYEEQFRNAFEARRLYSQLGDSTEVGRMSFQMAQAQMQMSDYAGSQATATEALKFMRPETKMDSAYLSSTYNIIAAAYRNQGFYEDAVKEYRHALDLSTTSSVRRGILNNLALVYQDQKDFPRAEKIFRESLEETDSANLEARARFTDNLAYTRWLENPSAEVKPEFFHALNLRLRAEDASGLLASYSHLSEFYEKKDRQKAVMYAEKLLETAKEVGSESSELEALEQLVKLSPAESSRQYALRFMKLNDSLSAVKLNAKNTFAKIRYDEERKQQEILKLENLNSKQALESQHLRTRGIVISLLALLGAAGGIFIFYYFRQKYKREKVKEVHKTESRISKKIHDELANDVYNLMSSLENRVPVPFIDQLENIYSRTRDISRENRQVETGASFLQNLLAMLNNNTPAGARLIISGERSVQWQKLGEEKKLVLYRVLQELMVNMKKHSGANLVAVIFSEEQKWLQINYSDTGKGCGEEALKKGNGLQNVENRIFSIKGRINFETKEGNGLKVNIRIPL